MKLPLSRFTLTALVIASIGLIEFSSLSTLHAQATLALQRDRGHGMLQAIKGDLRKIYYDPNFHGIDFESHFKAADEEINQAGSMGQILGIIAQALVDLDDSHTFFLPPGHVSKVEYGWRMKNVGNKTLISEVRPGSDAETKGVKVGDQILAVNGFQVSRDELWKLKYMFNTLRPQPGLRLVLQDLDGRPRQVDVMARIKQGKQVTDLTKGDDIWDEIRKEETDELLNRQRLIEVGENLLIWKMPTFAVTESMIDEGMGKARKRDLLILDLRGNPGGYVKALEWFTGYFFDTEVKIANLKGRKEMKPHMSKIHGGRSFQGKLVVLVDAESASAAELFARVVQLEKRGRVLGDRTAGAVMRARTFEYKMGADTVVFYGASITDADLIMADGKSLEKTGVTPDELLLPNAADLAAGRDPVITRAAALLGMTITPEEAGTFFPMQWEK